MKEHPEVFGEEADVSRIYVQAMLTREKNRLDIEWDGEKKCVSRMLVEFLWEKDGADYELVYRQRWRERGRRRRKTLSS